MLEVQFHNTGKNPNPIIPFLNYGSDDLYAISERQTMGVMRRGIGRIRKSVLPRFEIRGMPEDDLTEKVLSGARDPRFRYEAASFERFRLIMKEVDDVVRDFWGEARV